MVHVSEGFFCQETTAPLQNISICWPVILCSVGYNFSRNPPNEPLGSLVQHNLHSQSTTKTLILSYITNNWQGSFPKKSTFNEIPMFVKIIDPIPMTNHILC